MLITIAEDSALLREGIAQLLVAEGHEIIDAVGSASELIDAVSERQPQLVIVDVRMPPDFIDEGIRAALTIRSTWPQVAVMVLSQYVERRHATELLTAPVGWATYSRTASPTSPRSSQRSNVSETAEPHSTKRSFANCSLPAPQTHLSRVSPNVNAKC